MKPSVFLAIMIAIVIGFILCIVAAWQFSPWFAVGDLVLAGAFVWMIAIPGGGWQP